MYYQLTTSRLKAVELRWKTYLRQYCGAAPMGLGVAHIVAESNGVETPTVKDAKRRPIGLMQVPYRLGRRYGHNEERLSNPTINIYVWGIQTNKNANTLHHTYPSDWTSPDLDFWLAVRLYWMLDQTVFDNLYGTARAAGAAYQKMVGLTSWIRTKMTTTQHFGTYTHRTLQHTASQLDGFMNALKQLEGHNRVTPNWSHGPAVTPGNFLDVLEAGVLR